MLTMIRISDRESGIGIGIASVELKLLCIDNVRSSGWLAMAVGWFDVDFIKCQAVYRFHLSACRAQACHAFGFISAPLFNTTIPPGHMQIRQQFVASRSRRTASKSKSK